MQSWDPTAPEKVPLSSVIAGNETYEVMDGDIEFQDESILELAPDERAHKGNLYVVSVSCGNSGSDYD